LIVTSIDGQSQLLVSPGERVCEGAGLAGGEPNIAHQTKPQVRAGFPDTGSRLLIFPRRSGEIWETILPGTFRSPCTLLQQVIEHRHR
jgi:hypothetical protein